jgi:hypothetical protein
MGHGKNAHMSKGPEMGHSPNEMGHSPMENQNKGYSPMANQNKGYAKQERKDLIDDNPIAEHASWMSKFAGNSRMGGPQMKGSHNHKYDRVVLGGNKGDKSKTKPGKKDY